VIKDVALTALPTWVLQVQGLQELVLESTGMTGLYPNLGALTSVTRLVMRNQPLQNLDFAILAELAKKVPVVVIEKTKSLMWTHITPALLIGEQSMSAFDVGSLLNLEKLKSLELEKCNLIDTSFIVSRNFNLSSLAQLSCLEHLSLNANNLTRVPGFVSHLPNLKFLGLYGNQLQSMQQSIGVLTQLQKLECINLSKNKLKDMSFLRKLTTLPNLQNIRLLHNQIPIATDHEHWEIQGRTILIELEGNPKRPRPLSISHTIAPRTPPAPTPAGMFAVIEQYLSRWWE
jgi:Leucine-rich repeat (LRR) protein